MNHCLNIKVKRTKVIDHVDITSKPERKQKKKKLSAFLFSVKHLSI